MGALWQRQRAGRRRHGFPATPLTFRSARSDRVVQQRMQGAVAGLSLLLLAVAAAPLQPGPGKCRHPQCTEFGSVPLNVRDRCVCRYRCNQF